MRHEGSPHVTAGLSPAQVMEGLHEGVWMPTDEVRGPGDPKWQSLEEHPHFAEAVADYEPPKKVARHSDDHLDMNPIIDVALVLLIFFILTASYDALRTVMDMPTASTKSKSKVKKISDNQAKTEYVRVKARNGPDGKPVFQVDGVDVTEENLSTAISLAVIEKRNKMIIDAQEVTIDTYIKIIDAGNKAKVASMNLRVEE